MSDTPRTEAVNQYLRTRRDYTKTDHEVWMNHGIQIEHELNAANAKIKWLEEALEECDWAFTKFCPEHESRYGDAWEKVRDALNRPNPFKPYWKEAKP